MSPPDSAAIFSPRVITSTATGGRKTRGARRPRACAGLRRASGGGGGAKLPVAHRSGKCPSTVIGIPTFLSTNIEIRRAIADGEAKAGERLPPARDLAAILGVNTNTVLRSLRLLRDEGLLEFRRGRGVTVAGTPEKGAVIARARELVRFARQQGYRRDELIQLIEEIA